MTESRFFSRSVLFLTGWLLLAGLAGSQVLIGGTRLLFALPAYGVIGIAAIIALFASRPANGVADRGCVLAAILFAGYVAGRALTSPVDYIARADLYSVLACLVVYLLAAFVLTGPKARLAIVLSLIALALAHVAIGAIQFRDGNNFMPISFLQRYDYGKRASGFYICPNHLAGLLEMLGAFAVSIACWSRIPAWAKLLVGYAAAMMFAGEILTGSRGGYLSFVIEAIVFLLLSFFILRATGRQLAWRISVPALAFFLLVSAAGATFMARNHFLTERAHLIFERTNVRVDLWPAALKQWKLAPGFGTGSATFLYYGRHFRTARVQVDPVQAHNDYLQLLAEYGLIGGIIFAAFLGLHLRAAWTNFQRLGPRRVALSSRLLSNAMALNIGALTGLAALMVHGVFDFNMHIPANALLMALLLGFLASPGVPGSNGSEKPARLVSAKIVSAMVGLALVVQACRLLPGEYFTERARAALRDNNPAASILAAREGLEWEKRNPYLYEYLGRARLRLAESSADPATRRAFVTLALLPFQAALDLAPLDESFALDLAFAYDALGRYRTAEPLYQKAIAWDPKSVPVQQSYRGHLNASKKAETGK